MKKVEVRGISFNEPMPKVCIPVLGKTDSEILEIFDFLSSMDYDLAELRLDCYEYVEDFLRVRKLLENIRKKTAKPLLFTFRTANEGGMREVSLAKYFELNKMAIDSGAIDMLDIEFSIPYEKAKQLIELAKEKNVKIILSNHNFIKTPTKLEIIDTFMRMQQYDADISKIAVMPKCEDDVLTLLSASLEMKRNVSDRPFVAISMGSMGTISRLTGELFGSCLTFAALDHNKDLGQLNLKDIKKILELLKIS